MTIAILEGFEKPRLKALLEHFSAIDDPREPWRVAHPLEEVLLLVVCGTICACDDYDLIADWGAAHLDLLRRYLPYYHGVPGGRWLIMLMNRIDPGLFADAFTSWVRQTWPDKPDFVAIDGKTSRRSHDRSTGKAPLHLVSAFATTSRLVLGQEAAPEKSGETTASPCFCSVWAKTTASRAHSSRSMPSPPMRRRRLSARRRGQPADAAHRDRTLLRRCPCPMPR